MSKAQERALARWTWARGPSDTGLWVSDAEGRVTDHSDNDDDDHHHHNDDDHGDDDTTRRRDEHDYAANREIDAHGVRMGSACDMRLGWEPGRGQDPPPPPTTHRGTTATYNVQRTTYKVRTYVVPGTRDEPHLPIAR